MPISKMGPSKRQFSRQSALYEDYVYRTLTELGTNWAKNANMPILEWHVGLYTFVTMTP